MAKSLKSLRKGADKRALMKNKDGTPIHYEQQDQIPVITKVSEETVPHTDLKTWRKHAKEVGGYVEDHGDHLEAWDINHKKVGHFEPGADHGHIHDDRPITLKRQAEAVETLDELYPIFEEAGLFEYLSPSRKEEARSKAEYESHLAQSAAHAHVSKSAHKHARKAQRYLKLAIESRYGAGLPVNVSTHNPQTCRACQHLSKSGRFKTLGDLNKHAQEYPHIHGSYATDKTGKKLKEDTLIEAGSSKSNMKRKYLGKTKGRTKVGTKAHPIDVKPKITFKDPGAIGRAGTMKMPQPTAAKGL